MQYKSNIYFDADTFVIGNIDELFKVHHRLSDDKYRIGVTRDIRFGKWRETFNMGLFVIKPNFEEYLNLIKLMNDETLKYEFAMSEQAFLNVIYKDKWLEIGFEYNVNLAAYFHQRKYWNERESNIRVIHYTLEKPWKCSKRYDKVCAKWKNFNISIS